jgi:hypothetical protein
MNCQFRAKVFRTNFLSQGCGQKFPKNSVSAGENSWIHLHREAAIAIIIYIILFLSNQKIMAETDL